ncbi:MULTISPECIES: DUF3813 domain-containing protein [Bacillus]|uniref:DUF3813 domain-containing protein n=1 Tax=Bacillus TaxID=1386 RepID=UPI00031ECA62|nr:MULTISPECIES: DUF3813 domain-containing protein [Bacillus]
MANQLFQEARRFVNEAIKADSTHKAEAIAKAQNALSSAYANTTVAEQHQLHHMQAELDSLT